MFFIMISAVNLGNTKGIVIQWFHVTIGMWEALENSPEPAHCLAIVKFFSSPLQQFEEE